MQDVTASSGIAESTRQTHLKGMNKDDIPSPRSKVGDPDRSLDCQFAIEIAFQDLIAKAVTGGWGEPESCAAIIALAENHVLGLAENALVDEKIGLLKRQK